MTKEEQRFQAAVSAMQALLSDLSVFDYDQIAHSSVKMSDALIKELDNDSKKASIGINDLPYIESFPSQNRNSKTYDVIVADTVVTEPNPDAKVVTKTQIATQNINSIKTTPNPITEPSMNSIGDIKLRK